jgi:UDP-N-acetylmuramate--alanine ligase
MAEIMGEKICIAVAGTHGKTTTTSMITWILECAGKDPTFIVGGVICSLGTNARAGGGEYFCIEADEYDHMFLGLNPQVAAITHLEHDHPDCFPTFADMQRAFEQFIDLVPPGGMLVGCGDQPAVDALLQGARLRENAVETVQSCGIGDANDWQATEIRPNALGGHDFVLLVEQGKRVWGSIRLAVPGLHNVQNALVALAIADWLGIKGDVIGDALTTFPGVQRRFEVRTATRGATSALAGAEDLVVVDDYGHHPTEIRATLAAARARYGSRPVWAVFQPHTYSRLRALWDDFCASFVHADHVVVLDVYAAREKDVRGGSAASDLASSLVEAMAHQDARHIGDMTSAAEYIVSQVEPGAVVITLSAGDGNQVGELVLEMWNGQ